MWHDIHLVEMTCELIEFPPVILQCFLQIDKMMLSGDIAGLCHI